MSQRRFYREIPLFGRVEITAGWDRPLQYFFLTIYESPSAAVIGRKLYSNLDDETLRTPPAMTMQEIRGRLATWKVPGVPSRLYVDLARDKQLNERKTAPEIYD